MHIDNNRHTNLRAASLSLLLLLYCQASKLTTHPTSQRQVLSEPSLCTLIITDPHITEQSCCCRGCIYISFVRRPCRFFASLSRDPSRARAAGSKPLQPERARGAESFSSHFWSRFFFCVSVEAAKRSAQSIGRDAWVREDYEV